MQESRFLSNMWARRRATSRALLLALLLLTMAVAAARADDAAPNDEPEEPEAVWRPSESLAAISAVSAAAGASGQLLAAASSNGVNLQCERISFGFCASMPYNYTRMPNFFADANQVEAAERARHYELLAHTGCSRHLLAYLCELLAPMCLDGDSMKKFEIYPCRSFCRHVRHECRVQIEAIFALGAGQSGSSGYHHNHQQQRAAPMPPAFACDQLPYESNGGDGGNARGPCHETPEPAATVEQQAGAVNQAAEQQQQQKAMGGKQLATNYWPYKNELEANVPPYLPDTSAIDARIIRPPAQQGRGQAPSGAGNLQQQQPEGGNQKPAEQAATGAWAQTQAAGQQLALWLLRHSNLLSGLSLFCLLLLLNAKRLKRLKWRLLEQSRSSASSRKSSSSNSSSGSQRKLAADKQLNGGIAAAAAALQPPLSASSSSRSLMLIGGADLLDQPAQMNPHKLLIETPGSASFHQQQQQQRQPRTTLINLNGTLERNSLAPESARYHLLQSLGGHSQLLAQQQQQHQYDYIQVGPQAHQPQYQQMRQQQQQVALRNSMAELDGFQQRRRAREPAAGGGHLYRSQRALRPSAHSSSSGASSGKQLFASEQAAATSGKLYSNILLSSPSHQVLLFPADAPAPEVGGGQQAQAPPPPSSLPPPLSAGFNARATPPYYTNPSELQAQTTRSFQRRPSLSGRPGGGGGRQDEQCNGSLSARGQRRRHPHELVGGGGDEAAAVSSNRADSSGQESRTSAAGSGSSANSSSAYSPPASLNRQQQQPQQQFVARSLRLN